MSHVMTPDEAKSYLAAIMQREVGRAAVDASGWGSRRHGLDLILRPHDDPAALARTVETLLDGIYDPRQLPTPRRTTP